MKMTRRAIIGACCYVAALIAHADTAKTVQPGRLLGGKQAIYPYWFKSSFLEIKADIDEAATQDKQLLVMFDLNNCPYCYAMVMHNMSQRSIKQTLQRHFDVVVVNIRGDREVLFADDITYTEKTLAKKLGVQFTPTLLFFNPKSADPYSPTIRLNGYVPPTQFALVLQYLLSDSTLSFTAYRAKQNVAKQNGAITHTTFMTPTNTLKQALGQPFAVFFEQPDCPDCRAMHAKIRNHESLKAAFAALPVYQVNIWSNEPFVTPDGESLSTQAYAEMMNIQYAPTIVVFDETGKEVVRSLWLESFHLESMLRYAISGAYRRTTFQTFNNQRSAAIRRTGRDVTIWDD